jgi:hypothetical protein
MSTTPPTTATKTKTAYHILRVVPSTEIDVTVMEQPTQFQLVYQALEAANGEAAIRYYATGKPDGKNDKALEGTYVAIPSRSWVVKDVKVETQTVVTLA